MRNPRSVLSYLINSARGNTANLVKAGANNTLWGCIGGAIIGAILGSFAVPIVGTVLGFFVGGLLGAGLNYALR